ncbi:REP-associated tyrosine transposase [Pontibacillus marinus]|uniref:Transposase n=1 Tax=Pontibacillus marinus BH030004 = DSM 16465 TaxID=1385511 RepID=A0A0A5G654_9BACI|nr:transposase [Pontibacillus marinus]KGX86658.1 transposase [Pontibacillus marinus BH030004 = DSM 16465]
MPRRARKKSRSGIYHVIVRGANRQEIFHKEEDRLRFLETLKRYKIENDIEVLAWCLMDNHVHLLLKEKDKTISDLMKRLGISYASYYNWIYGTNGHLFQDRFKSENVETNGYLATVVRYIHMNPVKAGLVRGPEEYVWSSCSNYYGKRSYPVDLLTSSLVFALFSPEKEKAQMLIKEFHERQCDDKCLSAWGEKRVRLRDEEARGEIMEVLGDLEIPQVKSLPGRERDEVLKRVKKIEGLSQRQAARILGVSVYLVNRA